jgi:hypothetical protein
MPIFLLTRGNSVARKRPCYLINRNSENATSVSGTDPKENSWVLEVETSLLVKLGQEKLTRLESFKNRFFLTNSTAKNNTRTLHDSTFAANHHYSLNGAPLEEAIHSQQVFRPSRICVLGRHTSPPHTHVWATPTCTPQQWGPPPPLPSLRKCL